MLACTAGCPSSSDLPIGRVDLVRRTGHYALVRDPDLQATVAFDPDATQAHDRRAEVAKDGLRVHALASPFIGEHAAEFAEHLRLLGCSMRVVVADGQGLGAFMDYRPRRVNVVVELDVVTEIHSIG